MIANVKEIYSTEIQSSLINYQPELHDEFGIILRVLIGPENSSQSDSFDIIVCTPKRLAQEYKYDEFVWRKNLLIVFNYNFIVISNIIKRRVSNCTGKSWGEIANKLSAMFDWEFDSYKDL